MTKLRQALLDSLQARGYSRRTQESYVWAVNGLAWHYRRSPDRISEPEIAAYLLALSKEGRAPATVRLAWNGIAYFYRHVLDGFSEDFHPPLPKKRDRQPDILSELEVAAILRHAGDLRNRLLLTLAYSAGVRLDELRHLTWTDFDYERKLIRIDLGKGGKDRFTTLADAAIALLREYEESSDSPKWVVSAQTGPFSPGFSRDRTLPADLQRGARHGDEDPAYARGMARSPGAVRAQRAEPAIVLRRAWPGAQYVLQVAARAWSGGGDG